MVNTRFQKSLESRILALEQKVQVLTNRCSNLTQENINLRKSLRESNHLPPCKTPSLSSTPNQSFSSSPPDSMPDSPVPNSSPKKSSQLLPTPTPDTPKLSRSSDVVKGAKVPPISSPTFTTPNRFEVLASDSSSDSSDSANPPKPPTSKKVTPNKKKVTIILGDSNIKRVNNFVTCKPDNKDKVKVIGISGAKIQDCEKIIEQELTSKQDTKVQVILHAGTNNVHIEGTETIMSRYKSFVNKVTAVHSDSNVVICSLPDRHDKGNMTFSRVIAINNRLPKLCANLKASALKMESKLSNMNMPYLHSDGLHYNQAGAFVAADILAGVADHFLC